MNILNAYKLVLFCCFLSIAYGVKAQSTIQLLVENQTVEDNSLFFDIYLQTESDNQNFRLGNADFFLDFEEENFQYPTIAKVDNPRMTGNVSEVEALKNQSIVSIIDDKIVINVLGQAPTSLAMLEQVAPRISSKHKGSFLGRYQLSGIKNQEGTAGLAWVCEGLQPTILLGHHNGELEEQPIESSCHLIPNHSLSKVDEPSIAAPIFYLSPNPAVNETQLVFSLEKESRVKYTIYNAIGKRITSQVLTGIRGMNQLPIETEYLVAGMYILTLELENETKSLPLLIRK